MQQIHNTDRELCEERLNYKQIQTDRNSKANGFFRQYRSTPTTKTAYLQNRIWRVKIGNTISTFETLKYGVP